MSNSRLVIETLEAQTQRINEQHDEIRDFYRKLREAVDIANYWREQTTKVERWNIFWGLLAVIEMIALSYLLAK